MMFTTWIPPHEAEMRLDAEFYTPKYIEASRRIQAYKRVSTFEDLRISKTPISYGVLKPDFASDGTYIVSNADFDSPGIAQKGLSRIPTQQSLEYRRTILAQGDLLVTLGGYVGTAAVVPPSLVEANINRHIARVSLDKSDSDPYFYWAFIASATGTMVLERWVSGTAQPGINLGDLKALPIPWPEIELQQSIGNKVRKAERLRELAEEALAEANERMSTVVPPYPSMPEQVAWTDTSYLTDRLDPQPYRSHTLALLKAIRQISHTVLSKVCSVTGGCAVPSEEFTGSGVRLVRIRDIGDGDFEKPDVFVSESFCNDNKRYLAKEAMIVIGMDGSFRVQFFLPSDLPAMINQRVAMLNAHSMRPELVTAWLNRPEGQIQMLRRSVKTTVEHISLEDVRAVMLPRLDEEEENHLADKIRMARHHQSEAVHLIDAAKADVEALISNTLDLDALQAESAAIETWLSANPSPAAKKN